MNTADTEEDLFASNADRWLLATNTDNMKAIIAQGLITSSKGFTKYYSDALSLHEGLIPVFRNTIPIDIIQQSVAESDDLTTCIIEFNFDYIKGKIQVDDTTNEIDIEELLHSDYKVVYIPSPIPTSCIEKIIFQNKTDKTNFEKEAPIYKNVPLIDLTLRLERALFNDKQPYKQPQNLNQIMPVEVNYKKIYAYGGVIGLLFYYAKNGKISNELYKSVAHLNDISDHTDTRIKLIFNYFNQDPLLQGNSQKNIYLKLLDIITTCSNVKEDILNYLQNIEGDDRFKKRAQDIANTLVEFTSFANKTNSEQFRATEKSPLERMLLMLFLRDDSEDLIDFHLEQFDEIDYLMFCMTFGARDKFSEIPKYLREYSGLQSFVSTQMANYAHKTLNSNISFLQPKDEPKTLFDMFEDHDFKEWFARNKKIDCLKTRILIPKGLHEINVSSKGIELIFEGQPRSTTTDIEDERLFSSVMNSDFKEYNKYLKQYSGDKK